MTTPAKRAAKAKRLLRRRAYIARKIGVPIEQIPPYPTHRAVRVAKCGNPASVVLEPQYYARTKRRKGG